MAAHVSDEKKKIVDTFVKLSKEYPIVGAIDLEGMPTAQLQKMRATLRDNDIVLLVSKRRLMKIALEKMKEDKKGLEGLEENLTGMPAFIFSKIDSFKLYKLLKSSKSEAPAKPGQVAPKDIEVKAGPTPFLPGPIISELSGVGIKSGVEDGKVAIKEDAIVCKEGEVISEALAGLLSRLEIKPMEIGLNLTASYENGTIFKRDVLDIDEDKFLADITSAAQESFNLSVEAGYFTKDNVDTIIQNVFYSCKALAEESGFLADVVVEDMLASAERSAKSVEATADVKVPEAKAEEAPKAEEKPAEEKKEEEKPSEEAKPKAAPAPEAPKEEPKAEEAKPEPAPEPKVEEKAKPEVEKPVEVPKQEEKPAEPVKEEPKVEEKPAEPAPEEPKPEEKKEEKALEEEKEIIKEEQKLEEAPKQETPVEQEVQEAVKEEEEKSLEAERIDKEKEVEKIEEKKEEAPKEEAKVEEKPAEPEPSTDDKIAKMVEQQKKHATGEDKKESAEALVEEAKEEPKDKEVEEVENLVAQLKKGETLRNKPEGDDVPSLSELAKRKK